MDLTNVKRAEFGGQEASLEYVLQSPINKHGHLTVFDDMLYDRTTRSERGVTLPLPVSGLVALHDDASNNVRY